MVLTSSADRHPSSEIACLQVKESKWPEAILIVSGIACVIIGALASAGIFNSIGTLNAAYLSYGMYGTAALFLLGGVIKIVLSACVKKGSLGGHQPEQPLDKAESASHTTLPETQRKEDTSEIPSHMTPSEKPYSELGKEAITFARTELQIHFLKKGFKPHRFVKSHGEEALLQPVNQEIANLYSLYKIYAAKIKQQLKECHSKKLSPWEQKDVRYALNGAMKICYAISCLCLEDLAAFTQELAKKSDYRTYAQVLMSEDCYLRQTFTLLYNEFTSLHCGTFWEEHDWTETSRIIEKFKNDSSYRAAFYQNGTDQNNWRLLSNDFCDRLSLYTSQEALFNAGSNDIFSEPYRGRSFIFRHEAEDKLTIF